MRRNLIKFFIFLFIVIALDKVVGFVCKKLYFQSNEYTVRKLRYTLDSTKEDILILGSSRAEHHIVPGIISQGTGLSTYNCGFAGEGYQFALIQLNETLKRYKPKFIIVEASPSSLSLPNPEESLKLLLPYYKRDTMIYKALTANGYLDRFKFVSSIYPYNSTIASLISGNFKRVTDTLGGYKPLDGSIDTSGVAGRMNSTFTKLFPPEKFAVLKEIIDVCNKNKIEVVVVNSPVFLTNPAHDQVSEQIRSLCALYPNASYLDYSKYDSVYNREKFFRDYSHMNNDGATLFTRALSKDINDIVKAKSYVRR